MIINHNIAALNTQRMLAINGDHTNKSLEKLSSGLRINKAGDDAAGLAISEKMRSQIRGLDQAARNSQDGISMIQTAEGALNEIHSVLQRVRELAVQSSNGTLTAEDRAKIQGEVNQLVDEIDKIGNETQFNTKKLINGDIGQSFVSSNSFDILNKDYSAMNALKIGVNTKEGTYSVDFTTAATQAVGADTGAFAGGLVSGDWISVNGTRIDLEATDSTVSHVVNKINSVTTDTGVEAFIGDNGGVYLRSNDYGSAARISVSYNAAATGVKIGAVAAGTQTGTDAIATINGIANIQGVGTEVTVNSAGNDADGLVVAQAGVETNATYVGDTFAALAATDVVVINGVTVINATGAMDINQTTAAINAATNQTGVTATNDNFKITLTSVAEGSGVNIDVTGTTAAKAFGVLANGTLTAGSNGISAGTNDGIVTVSSNSDVSIHNGANAGEALNISINDMRTSAIGKNVLTDAGFNSLKDIKELNGVSTPEKAEDALLVIDQAIKTVSEERGKLGAYQNRLEHTIANLGTSAENLTAAESRIRDVDMAKEMMNFTKNNILSQAAQAMLAQANQQPQGVLQLLR